MWAQNITRLDEELVICDFQEGSYYEIVGQESRNFLKGVHENNTVE